jgi:D-xylose transport system permease protein
MNTQEVEMTDTTNRKAPVSQWLRRTFALRSAGIIYALIILVIALSVLTYAMGRPSYLSDINVQNVLSQTALVGILAIFSTVVLISGNFDLSIASTAALSGTVALMVIDKVGFPLTILIALGTGVVIGFINGVLVQKVGINAFIVTLGTLTAVRGLQQVLLAGTSVTATSQDLATLYAIRWAAPSWLVVGIGVLLFALAALLFVRASTPVARVSFAVMLGGPAVILMVLGAARPGLFDLGLPVWLMIALAIVTGAVLRFTTVGRRLFAVGGNQEAARLSGINVDRYKMGAFVVNGVMASLVGILFAGQFNSIDASGMVGFELTAIAAAILGGTSLFGGAGSVVKTVAGTLLLFTLANGFDILNLGANYQDLVQGIVLIAAASLYTFTLGGRRNRRRQTNS